MKVIEHEILRVLKNSALKVTQQGSEKEGYIPFDKLLVGTARLHYGTLVALLNENDINTQNQFGYMNINLKRDEIKITKYDWSEVAESLQILEVNGHIKEEPEQEYFDIYKRVIVLTKTGLHAYITQFYLKIKTSEKLQESLAKSTLKTNQTVKIISILSLIVSISSVCVAYMDYIKPQEQNVLQINIQKKEVELKDTTQPKQKIIPQQPPSRQKD